MSCPICDDKSWYWDKTWFDTVKRPCWRCKRLGSKPAIIIMVIAVIILFVTGIIVNVWKVF